MLQSGLDRFLANPSASLKKLKLAILCNQATVTKNLTHISEVLTKKKQLFNVQAYLGPQHGIRGEKQDDMIESEHFTDPLSKLRVISLYSESRDPPDDLFETIDAIVVDLQDIGTRIYTFMYTMANCMRACAKHGKKLIVLDRINPIGGTHVEGHVLETGFESFVGQFPICVRHGMTMGELAKMFNEAFEINCDLQILPLKGWTRSEYHDSYYQHWVPPSPNIPTLNAAITFPGTVLFEGTNLSEGRGTTTPLEIVGAPYVIPDRLAREMNRMQLPGVYFRPIYFQPTYQKWKDEVCGGVHIHVTHRKKFLPYRTGTKLLHKIATLFKESFEWKRPPYEYEHERMPIDLITGSARLRELVDQGKSLTPYENLERKQLEDFKKLRRKFLLY